MAINPHISPKDKFLDPMKAFNFDDEYNNFDPMDVDASSPAMTCPDPQGMHRQHTVTIPSSSTPIRKSAIVPLRDPTPTPHPPAGEHYWPQSKLNIKELVLHLFNNEFREDPWEDVELVNQLPLTLNPTAHWKVHDIFAESQFTFRDIPVQYAAIRSVLALASKMLEAPCLLHFWEAIFFGEIKIVSYGPGDPECLKTLGTPFPRISPVPGPITPGREQRVLDRFREMIPRMEYLIQHGLEVSLINEDDSETSNFDSARDNSTSLGIYTSIDFATAGSPPSCRGVIVINGNQFHEILTFDGLEALLNRGINPMHIYRTQWHLAMTFVHEMAHAAIVDRRMMEESEIIGQFGDWSDPQFDGIHGFEMGHMWELMTFGGFMNTSRSYPHWKSTHRDESIRFMSLGGDNRRFGISNDRDIWEDHYNQGFFNSQIRWKIPLKWYYKFFNDFFWEGTVKERGALAFHMPLNNGVCYAMPHTDGTCSDDICRFHGFVHDKYFCNVSPVGMTKHLPLQSPFRRLRQQQTRSRIRAPFFPRALDLRPTQQIIGARR
jgi:hypothetical protein